MTFSVKDWSEAYYRWARGEERNHTIADREILSDCVARDKYGKVIRSGHYDDGSGSCPTCGQVFGKSPGIEQ